MSPRWALRSFLASKSNFVMKHTVNRSLLLLSRPLSSSKTDENYYSKRERLTYLLTGLALAVSILSTSLSLTIFTRIKGDQNALDSREEMKAGKLKRKDKRLKMEKFRRFSSRLDCLVEQYRVHNAMPGVICEVHIGHEKVFKSGFGYCDVEQLLPCNADSSVFRIASISKAVTGLIAIKLASEGKLDLDRDIRHYLPEFPVKVFDGQEVKITARHLLNHRSGIRHYDKPWLKDAKPLEDDSVENTEVFCNEEFKSLSESIKVFQDDPLIHKPGIEFLYTSYGFVLLSAVLEKLMGKPFHEGARDHIRQMGLVCTRAEPTPKSREIVPGRIQGYMYDKKRGGKLTLCPEVTIMHKTAGGGLISNLSDLCVLGKRIAETFQRRTDFLPGVKYEVFSQILNQPGHSTELKQPGRSYSMGFQVHQDAPDFPKGTVIVGHGGNAVGVSSFFLVAAPWGEWKEPIVVAIAANIKGKSLAALAHDIVREAMIALEDTN